MIKDGEEKNDHKLIANINFDFYLSYCKRFSWWSTHLIMFLMDNQLSTTLQYLYSAIVAVHTMWTAPQAQSYSTHRGFILINTGGGH